jgi:hypothetical protein
MNDDELSEKLRDEFSDKGWIGIQKEYITIDGWFTLDDLKLIIRLWETRGKRDD